MTEESKGAAGAEESFIRKGPGGILFAGPDAVALYRAISLHSALRMYRSTRLLPFRGTNITKLLASAAEVMGRSTTYKRAALDAAIADLERWISVMRSALPTEVSE